MLEEIRKEARIVSAVHAAARRAGLRGEKLNCATLYFTKPDIFGLPRQLIVSDGGRSVRLTSGRALEAGLAEWDASVGVELAKRPSVLISMADEFKRWTRDTPAGRVFSKINAHQEKTERDAHMTVLGEWLNGGPLEKPDEGPLPHELPPLPSLPPGMTPPLDWLALRDKHEAAKKREADAALRSLMPKEPTAEEVEERAIAVECDGALPHQERMNRLSTLLQTDTSGAGAAGDEG